MAASIVIFIRAVLFFNNKPYMQTKALVVIDIQNDITKHYRDIVDNINAAIEWAVSEGMHIVYIKHNNITASTRTFKPGTRGEELVRVLAVMLLCLI